MIDTTRLLGAVLVALALLSACSDDPPTGPTLTTTARFVVQEADAAQQESLPSAEVTLYSRIEAMGLRVSRIRIEGDGIRVTVPGKHEQKLTALAQRGRLAFREVLAGPLEATGSSAGDEAQARRLRQSKDLAASGTKGEQAVSGALAVLSCDGADDPLQAAEDPALPLVACEQKPAEGNARMAYVLGPQKLDNEAIQSARARQSPTGVGFEINVSFTVYGESDWSDLTGRMAQESAARGAPGRVAFVLDTAVVSAPQVTERIEGDTTIAGDFTREEAEAIASVLATQPLPFAMKVTDLRVVRK